MAVAMDGIVPYIKLPEILAEAKEYADSKTKDVKLNGTSVLDSNNEAQLYVDDSVTSTETTHALSAKKGKELQDQISNLKNIGRFLAIWNCATGLPRTNPTTLPYTYKTGDYYRVGTVASSSATNYKPNGATYTGTASTTVETEDVEVGWVYYYDGTNWLAQSAGSGGLVQDVQINGTTIFDSGTGIANIPILTGSALGVGKVSTLYGTAATNGGIIYLAKASDSEIAAKTNIYKPIVAASIDSAIKAGLGSYAGTAFTDAEKETALTTLGLTTTFILD